MYNTFILDAPVIWFTKHFWTYDHGRKGPMN